MRHLLPTLLFAALAAVVSARPDKADLPPALVPLTQQAFTEALASDLAGHFNLEGDLQLELLRAYRETTPQSRMVLVELAQQLARQRLGRRVARPTTLMPRSYSGCVIQIARWPGAC